jgi:rhamnosyl/mannosyltransferase
MPQLQQLTRADQRVVVPFGFDLAPFRVPHPRVPELRRRFGSRIVFALGRHVYYKGFDQLIRAMQNVPDTTLLLGGVGPLTAELKALSVRLGLGGKVHFLERIPEDELPAYYQACDVFCMPSVDPSEAYGAVQVEAMACGKPVVCCELNNGVTWVNRHGETGIVVAPRDVNALSEALKLLLDDPKLRQTLGSRGALRADDFSFAAARLEMLKLYRRVLSKPQSGT